MHQKQKEGNSFGHEQKNDETKESLREENALEEQMSDTAQFIAVSSSYLNLRRQ